MLKYWVWLSELKGLRNQTRLALLRRFGDPESIFYADPDELMLTDQPLRILAVGARFGTEAGRGGAVGAGQVGLVQHLTGVNVGQGHLGGGDEVVVPGGHLEEVFLELGQLAGALHGGAVDHERRHDFGMAEFARLGIKIKVVQRALQAGNRPA